VKKREPTVVAHDAGRASEPPWAFFGERAMTIDEAIEILQRARRELGGKAPLLLADGCDASIFDGAHGEGVLYVCNLRRHWEEVEPETELSPDGFTVAVKK
jgi:hypothetical protein